MLQMDLSKCFASCYLQNFPKNGTSIIQKRWRRTLVSRRGHLQDREETGPALLPCLLSLFLAGFAAAAPQLKHKLTIHFKAVTIREYFKSTNDFWDKDLWWISCVVRSLPGHNQAALKGMISQPVGSI